jgi:hypothetical protein
LNSPNHENIDQWLFDLIEGNLSESKEQELRIFLLLNPEYEADLEAWEKSRVTFPIIDSEMVSSFNFGVKEEPEKRKKRPLGFWLLSATTSVMLIFGLVYFGNSFNATSNKQSQKQLIANKDFPRMAQTIEPRNKSSHASYARANSSNQQHWPNSNPLTKKLHRSNNYNSNTAFFDPNQAFDLLVKEPSTLNRIDRIELNTPKSSLIIQTNTQLLKVQETTSKQEIKRRSKLTLPTLHLSKNSILGKYLRKETSSATLKDRVFVIQEKSHLDIAEAFVGNRSQTRFQTMSTARWIGTGNQKLSQQISVDGYSRNLRSGFGVLANYSDFGNNTIQDWNVRLIYSPKVALGRFILIEPSISYVVGQKSINSTKAINHSTFEYHSNQLEQFNYDLNKPIGNALYYRDLNAGVNMNLGPVFVGVNTQNILRHQDNIHTNKFDTIDRSHQQTNLYIGTDFSAKKGKIMFSPMLSHSIVQGKQFTQLGASIQLGNMVLGGNYGSNSSVGALLGYQSKNFSIMAQSFKTKPLTSIEPQFMHQLTVRFNTNISRKTRRYLYL